MPESRQITIRSLTFNYLESGHPEDPLVMLLHGFPESSFMWRRLMDDLAIIEFHCIAPDLRGYSPMACPKGREHYVLKKLGQDVMDIASTFGKPFHLIAHDWGAAIGWHLAFHFKESILSYSALSVPHNSAFGKAYRLDKAQRKKSRYILGTLIPWLPEIYLRLTDFSIFRKLWADMDQEELDHNLKIFRLKKCLTASFNYYRANINRSKAGKIGKIKVPTLFIWGNTDLAITRTAAELNRNYMIGYYRFLEINSGHWLIQTKYEEVKEAIFHHMEKLD